MDARDAVSRLALARTARFRARVPIAMALSLAVVPLAPRPAAPQTDAEAIAPFIDGMVASNWIEERAARECEAVAHASPEQLTRTENWVRELFSTTRTAYIEAVQQYEIAVAKTDPLYGGPDPNADYPKHLDAMLEAKAVYEAVVLLGSRIWKCVESRRAVLPVQLGGVQSLTATWKASCTPTPGIQADSVGTLELTLDRSDVTGRVQWGDGGTSLEIVGSYFDDGSLAMRLVRPEALDEFYFNGYVKATGATGLTGSGTIRYGNVFQGCNIGPDPNVCEHRLSCAGRWATN